MHMSARRSVAAQRSGHRSQMAGDSGLASMADLEMGSAVDSVGTEGSGTGADLVGGAGLDGADAGDAASDGDGAGALASVGAGIRGGDGATRTIHTRMVRTRIGEVMAGMADTTITRRTVRT
jgi:hypothetical protein